jgi:hypothetical protein
VYVFIAVIVMFGFMLIFAVVSAARQERESRLMIEKHMDRKHREMSDAQKILNVSNIEYFDNIETPLSCDVSCDSTSCDAGCDGGSGGGD